MGKRRELMTTKSLVRVILEKHEKARSSDNYLYYKVLEFVGYEKNFNFLNLSVSDFLMESAEWGVPGFETVRRARQKLQAEFPKLAAADTVQVFRAENEEIFKEFARG